MKYLIYKFNPICKSWGIYDSTFCQVDAVAICEALQNQGYRAYIDRVKSDD